MPPYYHTTKNIHPVILKPFLFLRRKTVKKCIEMKFLLLLSGRRLSREKRKKG
jgi:hypothetical protein